MDAWPSRTRTRPRGGRHSGSLQFLAPRSAGSIPELRRTAMGPCRSRRDFLRVAGASLLAPLMESPLRAAPPKPSSPVSIARCKAYDREAVLGQLATMMDQLGGLAKLVAGKTVAVKVNL